MRFRFEEICHESNDAVGPGIPDDVLPLAASPGAIANWLWCCDHSQHAGVDGQARCDNNTIQFPDKNDCQAHKQKHDKNTGHNSKCVSR